MISGVGRSEVVIIYPDIHVHEWLALRETETPRGFQQKGPEDEEELSNRRIRFSGPLQATALDLWLCVRDLCFQFHDGV